MIISYFSVLLLNFIGMIKKNGVKSITIVTILFFWLFIAGDISSNDILNYLWRYNSAPYINFDIDFGYLFLEKAGNFFGLNYRLFRMILSALSILLITSTIKKYSTNTNFVFFGYFLYSIYMDTVQIRNFFAFSIIVYFLQFLIEDVKYSKLKFTIGIIIASTLHISNIVYLVILVVPKYRRKIVYFVLLLTFFLILLSFINIRYPFLIDLLNQFSVKNEKLIHYLSASTNYGFLIPFVLHLCNTFLMKRTQDIVIHNIRYIKGYKKQRDVTNFIDIVFWINIVTVSFFPLYINNLEFMRLTRNLLLINLIAYSIAFTALYAKRLHQFIYFMIVTASISLWFFYEAIINNHLNDVFINLLSNNYFFS